MGLASLPLHTEKPEIGHGLFPLAEGRGEEEGGDGLVRIKRVVRLDPEAPHSGSSARAALMSQDSDSFLEKSLLSGCVLWALGWRWALGNTLHLALCLSMSLATAAVLCPYRSH